MMTLSKQLTRSEARVVRAYALQTIGAKRAHLVASGAVSVYGAMPNTSETGWYFAGWAEELLAEARTVEVR